MIVFAALAVSIAAGPAAAEEGDAEAGRASFNRRCMVCHAAQAGQNKVGPSLHGVVGRAAGQVAGFNYSPALRADGRVWDAPALHAYLADPRGTIPGNRMVMPGIAAEKERDDLIAYLGTLR